MENLRSPRAIQRDDVWQAADALLLEGKRPTIERVRQKIGRGSPNTVSPMLEEWFATLGPRLAQLQGNGSVALPGGSTPAGQSGTPGVPQAVLHAAQQIWDGALQQATEAAQEALTDERMQLDEAQQSLEAEKEALSQAKTVMAQQRASLEQALAVAHAQVKMQNTRLAELEQAARAKEQFAAQQQQRLQALEQELFTSRKARDDADKQHAEQLRDQQAAAAAQQHRALQEIDRARQEAKQWMAAQRTEQEKLARLDAEWQTERNALQSNVAQADLQLSQSQAVAQQLQQNLQTMADQYTHQQALLAQQHQSQSVQMQLQIEQLKAQLLQQNAALKQAGIDNKTTDFSQSTRPARSLAQSARTARKLGAGVHRAKR
ncbi:MAG: DNA-binding protein [Comamonas sp.]